ncbi:MAG: DNA translocase FtsK [Oligoflexales bacterium]
MERAESFLRDLQEKSFKNIFLKYDYQREALLFTCLGLSCFYLISLFSFNPYDASAYTYSTLPTPPSNWGGVFGSYLAGASYYFLGLGSYLFVMPFVTAACNLLRKDSSTTSLSRWGGWLLLLLAVATFFGINAPEITVQGITLPTMGMVGGYLARALRANLGTVGVNVFIGTVAVLSFIFLTQVRVTDALRKVMRSFASLRMTSGLAWLRGGTSPHDEDSDLVTSHPDLVASRPDLVATRPDLVFGHPEVVGRHPERSEGSRPLSEPSILIREPIAADITPARHDQKFAAAPELSEPGTTKRSDPPYIPPSASLFRISEESGKLSAERRAEYEKTAGNLVKAFQDFSIEGKIVAIQPGPVVTVYEYEPEKGVKLSKITSLIDDIALAMKVDSIFIHPVSGKRAVGVEIPNKQREIVYLGDILKSEQFETAESPLTFAMGKSLKGEPVCADLTAMPHLLVAGQTGSGKSVAINALLCSIIIKSSPEDVRMILVDPKILELKVYEDIPHLYMPVITEPLKAAQALKWATMEMDRRYKLMELAKVRHITGFNKFWQTATAQQKKEIQEYVGDDSIEKLPYLIIVIDELADLMLTAPKEVEGLIQRLAQKARASGIHLVLATQRPSVDVITGVIKANLPSRLAFKVFSRADSRTILDCMGADKLLGKGDMLYLKPGSKPERIQSAFLDDHEVINLVDQIKKDHPPRYDEKSISWIEEGLQASGDSEPMYGDDSSDDPKWNDAMEIAQTHQIVSASFLQRHLKIGYNRAARIVEGMEAKGFVEKANGSKPRRWLGPSL